MQHLSFAILVSVRRALLVLSMCLALPSISYGQDYTADALRATNFLKAHPYTAEADPIRRDILSRYRESLKGSISRSSTVVLTCVDFARLRESDVPIPLVVRLERLFLPCFERKNDAMLMSKTDFDKLFTYTLAENNFRKYTVEDIRNSMIKRSDDNYSILGSLSQAKADSLERSRQTSLSPHQRAAEGRAAEATAAAQAERSTRSMCAMFKKVYELQYAQGKTAMAVKTLEEMSLRGCL